MSGTLTSIEIYNLKFKARKVKRSRQLARARKGLKSDTPRNASKSNSLRIPSKSDTLRTAPKSDTPRTASRTMASSRPLTSRFLGVSSLRAYVRWRSYIYINGKKKILGSYGTEEEAAEAYNKEAREYNKICKQGCEKPLNENIGDKEDEDFYM